MQRIASWPGRWGLSVLVAACGAQGNTAGAQPETQVLVVGTVHAQHARNPNYTYEDVARILDTYDPDVVCVEIRPKGYRKDPYLKEMMLATVWGVARGRRVCGFDDWAGGTRQERSQLLEQPEYVEKMRVFDSLIATNPITGPFDRRYGDYWGADSSFRFYNGVAYNRYFAEFYRLSLAVFGDSPINLSYEVRNRRMMDLAWDVIRRHAGGKIALLTGSEHKHYFDRDLAARPGIAVVSLESLLPLKETPLDSLTSAFLADENDLPYYEPGYPADTNRYYANKMANLVHGPDMDWRPDIIPPGNVEKAAKVLARWRGSQPASPRMTFDDAWVRFLQDDCDAAVRLLTRLADSVDSTVFGDEFVRVYTHRNLGLCYDLLGRRQDALRAYARTRVLIRGKNAARRAELALRDFETVPYARGRTAR